MEYQFEESWMIENVRQLDSITSEGKGNSSQTDVTSIARRIIHAAGVAVMMRGKLDKDTDCVNLCSGKQRDD